jgi:hypothetical protein
MDALPNPDTRIPYYCTNIRGGSQQPSPSTTTWPPVLLYVFRFLDAFVGLLAMPRCLMSIWVVLFSTPAADSGQIRAQTQHYIPNIPHNRRSS